MIAAVLGLALLWWFRAPVFRSVVHYRIISDRGAVYPLGGSERTVADVHAAIAAALDTTAARLHFSTGASSHDPRELRNGGPANCIGYAALCASLVQGHLERVGLSERYQVEAVVAKLYMGDRDLHAFFSDPFWKDHDVVRITDRMSDTVIVLDPTLYDRSGIGRVSFRAVN